MTATAVGGNPTNSCIGTINRAWESTKRGMVTPRYVKVIPANACLVTTMPATGAGATIYRR